MNWTYYGILVHQDLSFSRLRRNVCGNGDLQGDVERFATYTLQVRGKGRRFERSTDRLENKKATCVVLALFCACVFINGHVCARGGENSTQYRSCLLASPCGPNVELQQSETCKEDHRVDSS